MYYEYERKAIDMTEELYTGAGNIILENRKKLLLSGVTDTESFDDLSIILYTNCGKLAIKGEDLHITKLSVDSGDVSIEGKITSLSYSEERSKDKSKNESFISKLFR